tara:strand:+ start:11803 stop:12588 length:786 start_codon:yes stop_codon:yes gene_type:complete
MIIVKKNIIRYLLYFFFFLLVAAPASVVHAQDVDDEGEMFWGEDDGDEEYEEDEEEYYEEDDEEYEEEEEDDEEYEEYEEDEEDEDIDYEEEDDYDSEDIDLADQAEDMGWSIDISGSSPRFVNESLMTWNSSINLRASIEAPFLMQVMGMKFRFGAEFGTYGFEDSMPPQTAELKGITAMGITSFPVGPGKIKAGIGVIGSSVGSMFESSYGMKLGSLSIRVGVRYAKVLTPGADVKEAFVVEPETINWMDGLVAFGVNL